MARRAAFIKTLRDAESLKGKLLLLACPFEILPDGPDRKPDPKRLPAISQALSLMRYDAGALLPEEADALKASGADLPGHFVALGPSPATAQLRQNDLPIGIVYFPPSPNPQQPVPTELVDQVAKTADALRNAVRLVIGISPWGMSDEEAFLNAHPGTVDILLGSGPNAGTAGRPGPDGKTLWSRAYVKGKTINRLDLFKLPDGPEFTWKAGETFKADVVTLDETHPPAPDIQALFQ